MPKLTPAELSELLAAERQDAMAAVQASELSTQRERAQEYYQGDVSMDIPDIDGRSKAVSMDVSDTIEGLMPSLMDIFCGTDEVVRFDPVGPDDVQAAEQETDYVNHVFMQKNPGFMVLYSFIKDALLSKVGIVKVWWEEEEREHRETYVDLPEDAYAILASNPEVEIAEHTAHPLGHDPNSPDDREGGPEDMGRGAPTVHDVTIAVKKTYGCARVMPVPPEESGISRNARRIEDTGYFFHETPRSEAELIDEGYDEDDIAKLPSYQRPRTSEETARDTVDDTQQSGGNEGINSANRMVLVTEHYIRCDYDDSGPQLWRATTGGEDAQLLTYKGKLAVEQIDFIPFAAMTPVPITHRFFGRSVADLVTDIQRLKTVMLRALVDNQYYVNQPQVEVPEAAIGDSTLDDLIIRRPGGIIRTKTGGQLNVIQHPDISGSVYPMLEYLDSTREWRTGVTRQGQGVDANALQNQSATAVAQAFSAAQAKMKLIARIFAETGIRDMFGLLHATIRKHGQEAETVRLRNQWVQVDPRDWKERNDMTIQVGLGSGGKAERFAHLQMLAQWQTQALSGGMTNLCTASNMYETAKEACKVLDLKDVDRFWTDPKTVQAPQAQPDPKLQLEVMKQQHDQERAKIDQAHQIWKAQSDGALAERKAQLDEHLAMVKAQIDQQVADHKMALESQKHEMDLAFAGQKHQMDMTVAGRKHELDMAVTAHKASQPPATAHHEAPKPTSFRIVRDKNVTHVEPIAP